jgi:calcium-dependent protein kinase
MAPELLKGEYDAKVDVWSIGVIAFSLLSSSLPFFGQDRLSVMKKILKGRYRYSSRRWTKISSEAKNFVSTLLQPDPTIRPSAIDAMENIWLNDENSKYKPFSTEEIEQMDTIQTSIQAFSGYRTLKKLALMTVAYQSTSEEIGFLRKLFDRFDRYKDGEVTLQEFKDALADHYEYSDEELEHMFHGIDIDGTGKVHYIEFLAATIESTGAIDEERLAEAFDRIDNDESGYITVGDLKNFLGKDIPDSYIDKVIDEADIYHDHRVSYEEFLALWDKEADEVMSQSKSDVRRRRKTSMSRSGSTCSGNSSMVGGGGTSVSSKEDFTQGSDDLEDNHGQYLPGGGGDFYYSQRKLQSVRKVEIDMKDIIDFGNHHDASQ